MRSLLSTARNGRRSLSEPGPSVASTVESNTVDHNGHLGIGGCCGEGGLVTANEIAFNNTAGYAAGWEAGGAKWALANDPTAAQLVAAGQDTNGTFASP